MQEFAWLVALLASPVGRGLSGSTVTLDGGIDNWQGPWPPVGLVDDEGIGPDGGAAARRLVFARALRAKCCGCTEAFQASRAGSIPVARLQDRRATGSGAVW